MIILEHENDGIRQRALALFLGKARRAVGLHGEVNIRITSKAEMSELNRRFRRKNKATDVLSFPSDIPGHGGDVAISAESAAASAAGLDHSIETELKILILHGLLHLAGYDHETDNGQMRSREASLRRKLGLPVGLIERAHEAPGRAAARTSTASTRRRGPRR